MNRRYQKTLAKITIWLAAEILLNLLGMDDIADYSEFVFEKHVTIIMLAS